MKLGIAKYNEECRSIVLRYSTEWKKTVTRIGRWIDFENDYKTMDPSFMVRRVELSFDSHLTHCIIRKVFGGYSNLCTRRIW